MEQAMEAVLHHDFPVREIGTRLSSATTPVFRRASSGKSRASRAEVLHCNFKNETNWQVARAQGMAASSLC
jgi:hypothetical protein